MQTFYVKSLVMFDKYKQSCSYIPNQDREYFIHLKTFACPFLVNTHSLPHL